MTHEPWAETDTWPTPRILASSPHVSPSPREAKWAEAACTTDLFRIGRLLTLADSERAEDAATIAELRRDVAGQTRSAQNGWRTADAFRAQIEAAEAETAALRARIEALADEIRTAPAETWGVSLRVPETPEAAYMAGADAAITFAASRLRALAGAPAVTPTETQAEGGA